MNEREKYIKRIRHNYNEDFFKGVVSFAEKFKIMNLFFKDIFVEGVENVLEIKDKQIVYISNHVSLADFLVQGYVFGTKDLPVPRFIAGENLNHFPFGYLWKKCGAISIDRNMKKKEYWRVYSKEIDRVLDNGDNILIYPEGGRSYSGEISDKWKGGTLRKILKQSRTRDILGVPVFIKYDKRIEEDFLEGIRENKIKRDYHLEKGKCYDFEGKFFSAGIEYFLAGIQDRIYFSKDVLAYFKRVLSFKKGKAYLSFGKGIFLNNERNLKKAGSLEIEVIKNWENLRDRKL